MYLSGLKRGPPGDPGLRCRAQKPCWTNRRKGFRATRAAQARLMIVAILLLDLVFQLGFFFIEQRHFYQWGAGQSKTHLEVNSTFGNPLQDELKWSNNIICQCDDKENKQEKKKQKKTKKLQRFQFELSVGQSTTIQLRSLMYFILGSDQLILALKLTWRSFTHTSVKPCRRCYALKPFLPWKLSNFPFLMYISKPSCPHIIHILTHSLTYSLCNRFSITKMQVAAPNILK